MLPHYRTAVREPSLWADGGYHRQPKVIQQALPEVQNMTCKQTLLKDYVDGDNAAKAQKKSSGGLRWSMRSHPQAVLPLRQGSIQMRREESLPTVRKLRAGQSLPPHQTLKLRLHGGRAAPPCMDDVVRSHAVLPKFYMFQWRAGRGAK